MNLWRDQPSRDLSGENGFRLMPDDALQSRAATGRVETAADGNALLVRYTWEHPDDGPQSGVLLVGSPDDDGAVHGTWLDSWHQKPGPLLLTGTAADARSCALAGTYAGDWGWTIDVDLADGLQMTMRNVVPASAVPPGEAEDAVPVGAYDVMVMTLTS
jgi:hypothetical protein